MNNLDWPTELHRTGAWRSLADWLVRHNTYLPPNMSDFADGMARRRYDPTPPQFALLIQLRAGVAALIAWEVMQQAAEPAGDDYAEAAMADDTASAAEGAKVLASMLRQPTRPGALPAAASGQGTRGTPAKPETAAGARPHGPQHGKNDAPPSREYTTHCGARTKAGRPCRRREAG